MRHKQSEIATEFANTSSIAGVSRITQANSIWRRIFWIVALMLSASLFVNHFYFTVLRYYSYPKAISYAYEPQGFAFPDITLCPTNPFDKGKFKNKNVEAAYQNVFNFWQAALQLPSNSQSNTTLWDLTQLSLLPELSHEDIYRSVQDQIVYCSYEGAPCKAFDFHEYMHPTKLLCFIFYANERREFSVEGNQGLHLILNLDNSTSFLSPLKQLDHQMGYEVTIHPKNSRPSFTLNTMVAPAGYQSNLALTMTQESDTSTPISRCDVDELSIHDLSNYNRKGFFMYKFNRRLDDCRELSVQMALKKKCLCLDALLFIDTNVKENVTRVCHHLPPEITNTKAFWRDSVGNNFPLLHLNKNVYNYTAEVSEILQLYKCHRDWMKYLGRRQVNVQECFNPCSKVFYQSTVTLNVWPSNTSGNKALLKNIMTRQKSVVANISQLVSIKIYPVDLNVRVFEQNREFTFVELLSEFGGISGLWVGCCVMTTFEFVEVILLLLCSCCSRKQSSVQSIELEERNSVKA